ncbi:MAG: hypothetical protein JWP11_3818 [Frankiales bacterium]|nr:hypothetical protein [Frankiales bacterium]
MLDLVLGVLTPLFTLASFASPPIGDLTGAVTIGSSVGQANRYLPIDSFVVCIVAGLAFDLTLTGSQFLLFVYKLLPFKAT